MAGKGFKQWRYEDETGAKCQTRMPSNDYHDNMNCYVGVCMSECVCLCVSVCVCV